MRASILRAAASMAVLALLAAADPPGDPLPGGAGDDTAEAALSEWPLAVPAAGGEVRLYQPQVETLAGDRLTARAAFSLAGAGEAQPVFGVAWLTAQADIDRDARTVALTAPRVTRVRLPGPAADEAAARDAIAGALRDQPPVLGLDRMLAALADAQRIAGNDELEAAPPRIIFHERRAILLLIDGDPVGTPLPDARFERIQNTPFMLVRDGAGGACWLRYDRRWYTAPAPAGPWRAPAQVPGEVQALAGTLEGGEPDTRPPEGEPLDIVASLEPAELVSSDGPLAWEPVPDTGLLAAANTDSDLFLDTATQQRWLLLAGRWYRTADPAHGGWAVVAPGALPADFARIPPGSPWGPVLAHVPGTAAAGEAAADARVPQTAAVRRDATIQVAYDGEPQWQPVSGTAMSYAVNTTAAVLRVADGSYWCCQDAVWYRAPSPQGPWQVATAVPPEVSGIPPANPLYNVRYVYVYDTTPDWIYVGYTPGYLGCYVINGCVVWGTGYRYHCWWRQRYFPRPVTWGFGMAYNPWTGCWGVGHHAGHAGIEARVAVGTAAGRDWWGPSGWRPVIAHHAPRQVPPHGAAAPPPLRAEPPPTDNLYRRPGNRERISPASLTRPHPLPRASVPRPPEAQPARDSGRRQEATRREPERVLPGGDGEVFRRQGDTWQRWERGGWMGIPPATDPPRAQPVQPDRPQAPVTPPGAKPPVPVVPPPGIREPDHGNPPARPVPKPPPPAPPPPPPSQPSLREQLERQQREEDRGAERTQRFQQYRADPPDTLRQHGNEGRR